MMSDKNYTAQINSFANVIVCGDEVERVSYTIIFTGSYKECLTYKFFILQAKSNCKPKRKILENNL